MPFDEDDEDKVFWEIEAEPGETKSETFTAPGRPRDVHGRLRYAWRTSRRGWRPLW